MKKFQPINDVPENNGYGLPNGGSPPGSNGSAGPNGSPGSNGSSSSSGSHGELDVEIPEPGPDEHQLEFAYVLWFSHRPGGKTLNVQPYDQNLKVIGAFSTVEQFWAIYGHVIRPSEMAVHSDFHLFKHGIKPLWEDEANKAGGKWIVRLKKGLASRCWEDLILAILGEQFMVGEEICGAVVSVRFQEDIISVWNKTASDQHTTIRIRDTLKRVLNLPPNTIMEYKTHNDSLRDKSSFRNTDMFLH